MTEDKYIEFYFTLDDRITKSIKVDTNLNNRYDRYLGSPIHTNCVEYSLVSNIHIRYLCRGRFRLRMRNSFISLSVSHNFLKDLTEIITFNIEIHFLSIDLRTFVKHESYEKWQGMTFISV